MNVLEWNGNHGDKLHKEQIQELGDDTAKKYMYYNILTKT